MKTVTNKTRKPLSVPLPRGRTLHLGPGRTGQLSSEAAGQAGLQRLVAAGEIEISDGGGAHPAGFPSGGRGRRSFIGQSAGTAQRRSGDR